MAIAGGTFIDNRDSGGVTHKVSRIVRASWLAPDVTCGQVGGAGLVAVGRTVRGRRLGPPHPG